MTAFPAGVYAPRAKANKPGVVYDAGKTTVGYAEDVTKLDDEVVAIETELGMNPKGAYASVAAFLAYLLSKVISVFTDLPDTPASYVGQSGKVVSVKATEDGLEFIVPGATAAVATLRVVSTISGPVNDTTRYFGSLVKSLNANANQSKVYIRKTGQIKIADIYSYAGGAGSDEAWSLYIRLNDTTDYLIAEVALATNERVWYNAAININVVAGDYFEIKIICPTWATPPTAIVFGGFIYIE